MNIFFKSNFIQNFPIIIVAGGHYPKEHNVNLSELFKVKYLELKGEKRQWYNLHENKLGESPKLVIHTVQLSGSISDFFLHEIADEIKKFVDKNNLILKTE